MKSIKWETSLQKYDWFLQCYIWCCDLRPTTRKHPLIHWGRDQNGRRFAYDAFKRIFLNENVRISIKISLKFVSKGPINNNPALVQIMAWRRSGDKPLSEPMMVSLLTHICVARPQWVNTHIVVFCLQNDTQYSKLCQIQFLLNVIIKASIMSRCDFENSQISV